MSHFPSGNSNNNNNNNNVPNGTNNLAQTNAANAGANAVGAGPTVIGGGRFDFDDGGTYCGGWHDGKAHGHGICTGPKGQGEYSGSWHYGFEVSGIYKWPSGATYEGQWQNGKRHGIGVEYRGKWVYKGEWTQGYKGRYGVRASLLSTARYEGTWANGLQDGYGSETYADGGTYQGQWLRGMRHGYGVRTSAQYGHSTITKIAANQNNINPNSSLQSLETEGDDPGAQGAENRDAVRGGFVLVTRVSAHQQSAQKRRNSMVEKNNSSTSLAGGILKGLRLRKQRSTGDLDMRSQRNQKSMTPSLRSSREGSETGSTGSNRGDLSGSQAEMGSNASFLSQIGDISDPSTVETYAGEWKNDKRCGFGVCERSDGLRYEGEWYNNKKYGYGVTTFPDGNREEGKYKNNQLVTNIRKKHIFMMRSSKLKERIESAVQASTRTQQIALQKSDIAASRTATARAKSEQADYAASTAQNDSQMAIIIAKQYGGGSMANHSMAPLRRRLSDFSQVRRMRDGMPPNFGDMNQNPNQPPGNRQFLDPNEPFGGRRGSFRNNQMLSREGGPHSQMAYQQNAYQQQQFPQQFNSNPNFYPQMGSPPPNRYPMYPQQPPPGGRTPEPGRDPKDPFAQAFTDHFDHYAMMSQRSGTPGSTSAHFLSNSRIPSSSMLADSSSQLSMMPPSHTPSPVPSQSWQPSMSNFSPVPSQSPFPSNSFQSKPPQVPMANHFSRPPSNASSLIQPIPTMKSRNRMMNANPNSIDYSVDEYEQQQETSKEPGVRHLRTASLYRPGTQQPSTSSGGGGGGGGFKRKPSLQANVTKQVNKPVMSREEVSVLSHQQRETRRVEQEYRERLSRNPLLYLWSPGLINWLNRQKLVILVFIINLCIAYLFIRMIM